MSCFPCFGSQRSKRSNGRKTEDNGAPIAYSEHEMKKQKAAGETRNTKEEIDTSKIDAKTFTFRELATATKNFRQECLLGEGGFGRVYKGTLQSSGKVVAVKQLDRNGMEGNKEFLGEVLTLSNLYHPNLVHLIGYCADGDQRLLVHEYISGGTVDNHVLGNGPDHKALDWYTRVKIAYGAAMALEYLHDANPPIIYRDLKSSNILLDENLNPKLSGLAKLGPDGDKMHGPSRLMDTYGFCAPEISRTGEVTLKSDVYSFGLILLELITGRRAVDTTRPNDEQNLVSWAQPLFRDPKKFPDMADPLLNRQFPEKDLNQAVAIAAMCLQEEAGVRPLMSDVVATLSFLSTTPPPPSANPAPPPADPAPSENHDQDQNGSKCDSSSSDDDDDQDPDAAGDDEDEDEGSDNESVSRSQNHSRRSINDTSEEEGSEDEPQEGVVSESKEWHSFSNSSQKGNSMDGSTVSSSCRSSSKRSSASSSRKGDQNLDATVGNTTSSRSKSKSKSKSKCASVASRSSSKGSTQGSVSYTRASSRRTSSTKEESAVSSGSICSTTEEESPKNVDTHQNSSRGSEQDGTIVS